MKRKVYSHFGKVIILFLFAVSTSLSFSQIRKPIMWEELPPIPDKEGFAGMFVGVSNNSLLCMGGANFPDKMPWEGGKKIWYDRIYILEKNSSKWKIANEKLPKPIAYGVSFSYKNSIILVGGNDSKQYFSNVYRLQYRHGKVTIDTLASLPVPMASMTGALVGDVMYIAGGNTIHEGVPEKVFLAMNLAESHSKREWVKLDPWPGVARVYPVGAALKGNFYLFSGVEMRKASNGEIQRVILKDAYSFKPKYKGRHLLGGDWKKLSDMPRGVAAGASPAPTLGNNYVFFPGGLDGTVSEHKDPPTFPGFVTDLLTYDAENDSWIITRELPYGDTRVTLPAVKWGKRWVIPNGEKAPGRRSPKVFTLSRSDD